MHFLNAYLRHQSWWLLIGKMERIKFFCPPRGASSNRKHLSYCIRTKTAIHKEESRSVSTDFVLWSFGKQEIQKKLDTRKGWKWWTRKRGRNRRRRYSAAQQVKAFIKPLFDYPGELYFMYMFMVNHQILRQSWLLECSQSSEAQRSGGARYSQALIKHRSTVQINDAS